MICPFFKGEKSTFCSCKAFQVDSSTCVCTYGQGINYKIMAPLMNSPSVRWNALSLSLSLHTGWNRRDPSLRHWRSEGCFHCIQDSTINQQLRQQTSVWSVRCGSEYIHLGAPFVLNERWVLFLHRCIQTFWLAVWQLAGTHSTHLFWVVRHYRWSRSRTS